MPEMNIHKKDKEEITAKALFENDLENISDLSRLQANIGKYTNLNIDNLEINKSKKVNNTLKDLKAFK